MPLCNSITHQSIVLESCSNPEETQQVLELAMRKIFLVLGFRFFLSDFISEVGLWPFWFMLPGLGPNC